VSDLTLFVNLSTCIIIISSSISSIFPGEAECIHSGEGSSCPDPLTCRGGGLVNVYHTTVLYAAPGHSLVGVGVGVDAVVADGDEGAVVQEGDEHEHQDRHVEETRPRVGGQVRGHELWWLEREHRDEEEYQELQGRCTSHRQRVSIIIIISSSTSSSTSTSTRSASLPAHTTCAEYTGRCREPTSGQAPPIHPYPQYGR
jgi:hypothetical protein